MKKTSKKTTPSKPRGRATKPVSKSVTSKFRGRAKAAVARPLRQRQEVTGWNAERILAAVSSADSGDFRDLGDLCAAIQADDRVRGVLSTRTSGLLGLPLDFVFGDQAFQNLLRGDEKVQGLWYKTHPESELAAFQADAIIMGMGLAQRVPTKEGYYRIQRWDPGDLSRQEIEPGIYQWKVRTADGYRLITPGDGEWILHCPYGEIDPYKRGAWIALILPWLLKRLAAEDRSNGSEQAGLSNPTLIAGEGSTEKQRSRVAAQFASESRKLAMVLPHGWEATYLQPPQKIFEIYSETIAWADAASTIVLAGQVVTTEGSPGFSSGNVQDQILNSLLRYDGESLSYTLHSQDLAYLAVSVGFEEEDASYPCWNTTRPLDRESMARIIQVLGSSVTQLDGSLAKHNKEIDLPRFCELLLIPLKDTPKKAADVQTSALQSAQITAVTDTVLQVALGQLPRNTGLHLLISLMGVEPAAAERILDECGKTFQPAPTVPNARPSSPQP